jgi:hypothetical protein
MPCFSSSLPWIPPGVRRSWRQDPLRGLPARKCYGGENGACHGECDEDDGQPNGDTAETAGPLDRQVLSRQDRFDVDLSMVQRDVPTGATRSPHRVERLPRRLGPLVVHAMTEPSAGISVMR